MEIKLTKPIIEAIENTLNAGYDVEVRRNKYGPTVASVGKKVIYKGNPIEEPIPNREGTK